MSFFQRLFGSNSNSSSQYPLIAEKSVMNQKSHGTSKSPVQQNLRWNCDNNTADRICSFNRHKAEASGYFWKSSSFLKTINDSDDLPIQFYDSVTGALLFQAPIGRSMKDFIQESKSHGWPSFRDQEVVWDRTRCLKNGECVSIDGTHLGHNLPDRSGNRYCINLVCIAGRKKNETETETEKD
mmetsp:Transcript_15761/g.18026  ORF Transcript_15761/g.18026 Transcript_15761/m.18026 type:complete len:183 (-) Transcript_15761:123-671(-)